MFHQRCDVEPFCLRGVVTCLLVVIVSAILCVAAVRFLVRETIFRAPGRIAGLPRKFTSQGCEHIKYGPGDDEVIVEHDNGRHDDHAVSQASKERAELLVDCHRAETCVLTERQFHEHERQSRYDEHHSEWDEEGASTVVVAQVRETPHVPEADAVAEQ